jgi:hypothetical protein
MRKLSYKNYDPCAVFEDGSRVFRKIPAEKDKHWEGIEDFLVSQPFKDLQDKGWVPKHAEEFTVIDGERYIQVERVPFVNRTHEWTREMLRDALRRTFEIQWFLEDSGSEFRLTDAHNENLTFYYGQPIYIDTGSFSKHDHYWFLDHVNGHFAKPLGLEFMAEASRKNISKALDGVSVAEQKGEWSDYPQPVNITKEERWLLERISGDSVLDVAGNKGRLAGILDVPCCTIDADRYSVQESYRVNRDKRVTSLVVDIRGDGWRERLAADTVVASGITHHLYKAGFKWGQQAELWRRTGKKFALVEFIDRKDSNLGMWSLDANYNYDEFLKSLKYWTILDEGMPEKSTRRWVHLSLDHE